MRAKLIAGNVLALLFVGVIAWLVVRSQVADALGRDVGPAVQRGVGLLDAVRASDAERFKSIANQGAALPDLRRIFSLNTETEKRDEAFAFANRYARDLENQYPPQQPRAADIVAVTDATGHVLARNVDANLERNRDVRAEFEVVEVAIRTGQTQRDLLKYDQQKWYDVVVAPVHADGGGPVVGLLILGYELADNLADADARRLGADVGYVVRDGGQFVITALSRGAASDKDALNRWANSSEANLAQLFAGEGTLDVRDLQMGNETWRISARHMPNVIRPTRPDHARPGVIVLMNLSDARAPATPATMPLVWLLLVGLAMIVGYNLYVANYLLNPIEDIEEGLLRIINGDRDHRIELQHAELGGIVYRVNQLVSELTGAEEETDESGRVSRPPPRAVAAPPQVVAGPTIDESVIGSFNPAGNAADAQVAQQLANEPENDYYDRLHREWTAARQRAGLGDDGMAHEQFVEMVRNSEQMLAQKYALTLVRFLVAQQGNYVVFRAIPIR